MPVISPRRSSTSASGNIYGTSTSSSTSGVSGSSDTSSRTLGTDRSSSGYKSYLDRASSLSKLTSSSSSYSPSSSYLGSSSYSSYSPRSYSTYRPSGSSLTGGSSGVGTYRSTFSSLGSSGSSSYDTSSLSRYGVNRRSKASDTLKKDSNDKTTVAKKPPSGSDYGGGSIRDSKRLSGSSSSSSLARLVATSGLDLFEKYSPAYYKPNTQLDSGSRSSLNEAGTDLEDKKHTTSSSNDITANITLDRPRTNRYSRIYSRNDSTDETDNVGTTSTLRRSTSGTRSSGRLSASNSTSNLQTSGSTEDVPTATFTLRSTRLRKSKINNDEDIKPLRNGTSSVNYEIKNRYSDSAPSSSTSTSNGIDTVAYVKLNKLKISDDDKTDKVNNKYSSLSNSSSSLIKSGSSGKLRTSSSREAIGTATTTSTDLEVNSNSNNHDSSNNKNEDLQSVEVEDNELNKPRTTAAKAATLNGMRRTGNGTHLGTTTAVATSINKVEINYTGPQFKGLSSATATSTPTAASSASTSSSTQSSTSSLSVKKTTSSTYTSLNTSYGSTKLISRTQVKPLVHRSAAINTASVSAITNSPGGCSSSSSSSSPNKNIINNNTNNNNGSNSSLNSITNSGNNNMQTSLDQDDIKFIDSDEQPATGAMAAERKCEQPRCCLNHSHSSIVSKSRVRPKSTIICSTSSASATSSSAAASSSHAAANNLVFEKVNNYKYANGVLTSTTASDRRTDTAGIDSNSIRASIEKFNSFSEQKRLPLSSVTLRSHSGSGSTSNLQHHRHSSDLDNCNLRLPNSGGGSLTRTPYRSSGSTAGKVITSIYPNVSAAVSSRHHHHHHHHQSALSNSPNSTGSLPLKSSKHYVQAEDSSYGTGLSSSVDGDVSKKKLTSISGGLCSNNTDDNSVRSSAPLRSVLPPASPTSSRYWDRDSSRSSLISSSTSHNHTDENKKSAASDEETEGLCGLRNIGNTCFMNSVIQCLSHTSELTKYLRNYNATKSPTSKDQQILFEFSKLIKEMWTNNVNSVTPMELKRAFSAKHRMYSDYNQQDAQEFLRFFLDSLHGALNSGTKGEHLKIDDNLSDNKKAELTWDWYGRHENSLIRDLFVGQLKSTLRCTTCGNTSVTFDPFWDLSVPLPSSSRCKLDACLDLFIREEVLDGDEMPTCSKCQTRRKCTKSFAIQRFPKYLVIHLKRFSETRWSKLSNIVEFPTGERELNMGPYGANTNSNIYSLYAISNHMGSTAGGHYVAICKHPVSKKWHEFNDNLVSDSLSEHHLVSSSAYILFYERA